jgi:hypothetical protein
LGASGLNSIRLSPVSPKGLKEKLGIEGIGEENSASLPKENPIFWVRGVFSRKAEKEDRHVKDGEKELSGLVWQGSGDGVLKLTS